jgi:hypothetical protein
MFQKLNQLVPGEIPSCTAKPNLYLHAGTGKTGSSGLQKFLGENYKKLRALGINYPLLYAQAPLDAYPWSGNLTHYTFALFRKQAAKEDLHNTLAEIYNDAVQEDFKTIFSSEDLNWWNPQKIDMFCATLRQFFSINLVFFLRDPLPWSYSAWKQITIFENQLDTFEQFLVNRKLRQIIHPEVWFQNVDNVYLFSYDEHKRELVSTFFTALGIDIIKYFPDADSTFANPSLNASQIAVLQLLHHVPAFPITLCHLLASQYVENAKTYPNDKPDPALAELAIKVQEPMFQFTDQYLDRSKIIKTWPSESPATNPVEVDIDPEDIRISLEVIAQCYISK